MPRSTRERLDSLYKELATVEPGAEPSWQVCEIFNALLEQVRSGHEQDPVLKVIQSVTRELTVGPGNTDCLTLRIAVKQLMDVF